MTKYSRNFYNIYIFTYSVFSLFKKDMYKKTYEYIKNNKLENPKPIEVKETETKGKKKKK